MKKIVFFALLGACTWQMQAQKFIDRSGEVHFEASMPALEEVAATNKTASAVLDSNTGDIATLVLLKGFKFKVPLMEEHFNENYVESDKFPKAMFKGKLIGFDASKFNGKGTYEAEGELTLHGVTKHIKVKVVLTKTADGYNATTNFSIKPEDYNIEIPSVVRNKISESIKISGKFDLKPKA